MVRYKSFRYQAKSWTTPRRIVAKVEHHRGELFPRVGFIVTNMALPSRSVVRFYNKRGTAEQWIKEGKQATHWTRLSCPRFRANEVRLQLSVLAYNLGNLWRRLVLPPRVKRWSLTSLQQRLVKTGGRLVKHARYYWLLLAEGHLTRRLFGDMLRRIWALPDPRNHDAALASQPPFRRHRCRDRQAAGRRRLLARQTEILMLISAASNTAAALLSLMLELGRVDAKTVASLAGYVDAVVLATLEWVNWFNRRRLLAPIGYVPPVECEQQYYRSQTAPVMLAGVT